MQAELNAFVVVVVVVVLLMPRPDTVFAFVAAVVRTLRIYFNAQTKWQEKFTSPGRESGPQPQSNKAGTTFWAVPKIQLLLWLIMPHKLATGWQRFDAACFPSVFFLAIPYTLGNSRIDNEKKLSTFNFNNPVIVFKKLLL